TIHIGSGFSLRHRMSRGARRYLLCWIQSVAHRSSAAAPRGGGAASGLTIIAHPRRRQERAAATRSARSEAAIARQRGHLPGARVAALTTTTGVRSEERRVGETGM